MSDFDSKTDKSLNCWAGKIDHASQISMLLVRVKNLEDWKRGLQDAAFNKGAYDRDCIKIIIALANSPDCSKRRKKGWIHIRKHIHIKEKLLILETFRDDRTCFSWLIEGCLHTHELRSKTGVELEQNLVSKTSTITTKPIMHDESTLYCWKSSFLF